jgi:hypothetical protein
MVQNSNGNLWRTVRTPDALSLIAPSIADQFFRFCLTRIRRQAAAAAAAAAADAAASCSLLIRG